MKISYKWLQAYFEEKLPAPEKLAERLTFAFVEVESMEKKGDDTVLDIKVLPDRACYTLSHRGMAYEVAAILDVLKKKVEYPQPKIGKTKSLSVRVEATDLCPRYMAQRVEGITQKELSWTKEHLEAVGQRSINPVVDGANLVMFDRGQPLHAFDADKVEGGIVVRMARKSEKITTLDNRDVALDESILIIADEKSPLAIAGIKGGTKAAVTKDTKNLILESASFNASYIRKASERVGIRTDASKRFENRFSASLAAKSLEDFAAYLFEMDKAAVFGEPVDWYPVPVTEKKISITPEYIAAKLGASLSSAEIEKILARLLITVEKRGDGWVLTPPLYRADLVISEDIVEEVGRIFGYDKLPATLPPKAKGDTEIPKSFCYEWKIREILAGAGFSEVMTSSFSDKGVTAIEKPLADDKNFARAELRGSFEKTLKMNALNAPLFGATETRIFEIGHVFTKNGEQTALAIGFAGPKKKVAGELALAVQSLSEKLGVAFTGETKDGIFECDLDSVFTKLPEPKNWDISVPPARIDKFIPFSVYPFIVRDIAIFVEINDLEEKILQVIFEMANKSAGKLLIKGPLPFDRFEKDGKKSLAFRLVFQSSEKTLTDDEVNGFMEKIYSAIKDKGWEVR